ncbi:MAG: transcription-repair coupling factor [Paludibacteraceae bacterium]|nr:transcription-repair coupling factor [Paludibacteraceae bacterium]
MTLQDLQDLYSRQPQLRLLGQEVAKGRQQHFLVTCLSETSAWSLALHSLFKQICRTMLVVLNSADDASYMQSDLAAIEGEKNGITGITGTTGTTGIIGGSDIFLFPSSYRQRQRQQQADESYLIQRTEVLNHLVNNSRPAIIVTYADALLDKVPQKAQFTNKTITLNVGQQISQNQLSKQLVELGFLKVDFVYEPGQFAIRGGIFDVFSFSHEEPYRLDFFGDEIDTIRIFDIETQLSKEKIQSVEIISSVSQEQDNLTYFTDYLPQNTICISDDFTLLKSKIDSSLTDNKEVFTTLSSFLTIEFCQQSFFNEYSKIEFSVLPQPIFHKNFDLLIESLKQYQEQQYHIYILSASKKQTDRIAAIFEDKGANVSFTAVENTLHTGFVDKDAKICCLTDHQIFERFHKVQQKADNARKGKVLLTLKELNQLQVGDYVVHVDHGVAKFGGLVHTLVGGRTQEMIKLIYRDNDILFVSIHSLHRISKYRSREGDAPNISKLGSGQWDRLKERTKQKVKDIARDLIKLYAQRRKEQGFQYSPDSYLQHELEASFLYEDTPDQQKATIDLKHDMESPVPMDRLICGDVGFGKTELAMRAAFKAATDGKQTAVLVPTTVLALQHYNTFTERFKNFPVKVEYLSRAKSTQQTKEILSQLAAGEIDILIGTHKLVGRQVHFKDLGLLIIDEEQKFGVATKEKLRQLKVNVDTLTLTATPIPRTLQFSLLGARDLSVMTTPPPNRYPVQTELITPEDEDIIKEAIEEEIGRNGQVFVVNNRIQTLSAVENKIRRLCPDARVISAHGQMPPEQMEQILTDFINYDYDVLVATSIIESGVDIPNVNTIIINNAHQYGLSDLHQLRGRVGRSNRKAYCYLVAPSHELLTTDARRRLRAVETFADLGSGFHIAMQDLDIRGAGNMLGAEQSGFIADLGYETYQKILNEAVLELKEEEFSSLFADEDTHQEQLLNTQWVSDCQLDSDLNLGFPEDYVENISERITLYRELDDLKDENALVEFQKRMIDRFGTMPQEALELLMVVRLRWLCIKLGIEKCVLKQDRMTIFFPQNDNSPYYQSDTFGNVINYLVNNPRRCQLRDLSGHRSAIILNVRSVSKAYEILTQMT